MAGLGSSAFCSGLSRIQALLAPLQELQREVDAAVDSVLDDQNSYGWMVRIFGKRYKTIISQTKSAKRSGQAASATLARATASIESIESEILNARNTSIPAMRSTALRWCNSPGNRISMERDICSATRTRREMMRGRKVGAYQSWKKSCDMLRETRGSTVTATYGWPRRHDETGCVTGGVVGWDFNTGCPLPRVTGSTRRTVYEEGCTIDETCYSPSNSMLAHAGRVRSMANSASDLFNDDSGRFYTILTAIEGAIEDLEQASRSLGSALEALHDKVKHPAIKSTIIALATAATSGIATIAITSAYNQMQKAIKKSKQNVQALPNKLRDAHYLYMRLKESGWNTSAGCDGGWETDAEDSARTIKSQMDRVISAMNSLTSGSTCANVYPSRSVAQWTALGVETYCPDATAGMRIVERIPTLTPWREGGGGSRGGIPSGGGAREVRTAGLYGALENTPATHFGLSKKQWLLLGALGATVYYIREKR